MPAHAADYPPPPRFFLLSACSSVLVLTLPPQPFLLPPDAPAASCLHSTELGPSTAGSILLAKAQSARKSTSCHFTRPRIDWATFGILLPQASVLGQWRGWGWVRVGMERILRISGPPDANHDHVSTRGALES